MKSHRGRGPHEVNNCSQHSAHIPALIQKSISLGKCHCAHDVEGEELQPLSHVKDLLCGGKSLIEPIADTLQHFIYQWLEGGSVGNVKDWGNGSLDLLENVLLSCVEDGV